MNNVKNTFDKGVFGELRALCNDSKASDIIKKWKEEKVLTSLEYQELLNYIYEDANKKATTFSTFDLNNKSKNREVSKMSNLIIDNYQRVCEGVNITRQNMTYHNITILVDQISQSDKYFSCFINFCALLKLRLDEKSFIPDIMTMNYCRNQIECASKQYKSFLRNGKRHHLVKKTV